MAHICIMITSEYPYGYAEPFLEDEIIYLSNTFDKIIIFPINIIRQSAYRKVPDNVSVYPCAKINGKISYLYYTYKGIFNNFSKGNKWYQKVFDWYLEGKTKTVFDNLKEYLLSEINPADKVCVYSYWMLGTAMVGCQIKKQLADSGVSVKTITRAHGYDLYADRNMFNYLPFQREIINSMDYVYTCSYNGKKYLEEKYGISFCKGKVRLARLGTNDYGVNYCNNFSGYTIVTCSNIIPLKRIDLFARAFCKAAECINIRWVCIGDGCDLPKVKRIISSNKCNDKVVFRGRLKRQEVINFYIHNPISIFVNVSKYEGVPVSIMEAQSFGIPVIACDVGGISEIVNKNNGLLIDANVSSDELANILISQCKSDELLTKQKNSRIDWEQNSSASKNYTEWSIVLNDLLG